LFTAHTLRHTVTANLTFDPLALNVCSVSAVMWSNSVPNSSEIEQFTVELNAFTHANIDFEGLALAQEAHYRLTVANC